MRAPRLMPEALINAFVQKKTAWIQKQLQKQHIQLKEIYAIENDSNVPIRGQSVHIVFTNNAKRSVNLEQQQLIISGPGMDKAQAIPLFLNWIRQLAAQHLENQTKALARQMGVINKLAGIKYRRTKSKWGHCTSKGVIQYNPMIMMAPDHVIDYLVAHEVCHLSIMAHSPAYWALVESVYPEYLQAKAWLKDQGHRLNIGS